MDAESHLLGKDSQIRLPNVEEALRVGYAMYIAGDKTLAGTPDFKVAENMVENFRTLEVHDQVERAYLIAAGTAALGLSRGLRRRKDALLSGLERAERERGSAIERLSQARNESVYLQYGWFIIRQGTIGLLGYLLAQMLSGVVPDEISMNTGTKMPGFVAGGVCICFWRWVTGRYSDLQRNMIEWQYHEELYDVENAYNVGRQLELRVFRQELCDAWKQYTGHEPEPTLSYSDVIDNDLLARQIAQRRWRRRGMNAVARRLVKIARLARRRPTRIPQSAEQPTNAS